MYSRYIIVLSFFIWGFFNFLLIRYKKEVDVINVIFLLYLYALTITSLIIIFYKKDKSITLSIKEKFINIIAGASQALVYVSYFNLLFLFPNDAIVIVIVYNLFGFILIIMDALFYKTKNNLFEILLLLVITILVLFLIIKTQMLLGKTLDNITLYGLLGLIPAFFAAFVGMLYKYFSIAYKIRHPKDIYKLNLKLLFYRALGGFILVSIFILIRFLFFKNFNEINKTCFFSSTELYLGFLYAIFPFLMAHFFYSISIYKKISILMLSLLMNISPIITLICLYFFSGINYKIDVITISIMILILLLSTFLTILHNRQKL